MRLLTRLRSSSALWAAPFALAMPLLYYSSGNERPDPLSLGYAPAVASYPLLFTAPFAYAVASGLAVWESGRLRSGGVWGMAPARSRHHVAAHALQPVLALAWLMLLLPVALALVQNGIAPTPASLRPLAVDLTACAAFAVIGFGVGVRVPHVLGAPICAAAVWVLVSSSWAIEPLWLRHISGRYPEAMAFGEAATYTSMVPHVLFVGGIAAGVALLWLPLRHAVPRVALASAVALAGTTGAVVMVDDWGTSAPLSSGNAPVACAGRAPRVCMPEAVAGDLGEIRHQVASVLEDLDRAGVAAVPARVSDRTADGRSPAPSTPDDWRLALAENHARGTLRYAVARAAVRFPCSRPDPVAGRAALLWAVEVAGEREAHRAREARERTDRNGLRARTAAERQVERVLALPSRQQSEWYGTTLAAACSAGGR